MAASDDSRRARSTVLRTKSVGCLARGHVEVRLLHGAAEVEEVGILDDERGVEAALCERGLQTRRARVEVSLAGVSGADGLDETADPGIVTDVVLNGGIGLGLGASEDDVCTRQNTSAAMASAR